MDALRVERYRFVLEAIDRLSLPEYSGSTLRGGFGQVFRRTTCVQPRRECSDCPFRLSCPYSLVFCPSPPPDSAVLRTYSDIPRPFVLEPPEGGPKILAPGQVTAFGLVLVGRATDYLPHFLVTFQELGRLGLGRGRGRFMVKEVWQEAPIGTGRIYEQATNLLRQGAHPWVWKDALAKAEDLYKRAKTGAFEFSFHTPLRLVYEERLVNRPELHILMRSLLRRLSSLSYFHCNEMVEADFKRLIALAERAKLVRANLSWMDWERYSSRQDSRMKLGGLVGKAVYAGVVPELLPWLCAGEWVHVGKAATFGLGRYGIKPA